MNRIETEVLVVRFKFIALQGVSFKVSAVDILDVVTRFQCCIEHCHMLFLPPFEYFFGKHQP